MIPCTGENRDAHINNASIALSQVHCPLQGSLTSSRGAFFFQKETRIPARQSVPISNNKARDIHIVLEDLENRFCGFFLIFTLGQKSFDQ